MVDRRSHEELKRGHELAVAARFADFLESEGIILTDPRPGDHIKREPDVLYTGPTGVLGVEVACADYDDEEARDTWEIARGHPERSARLVQPGETVADTAARGRVLKDPDDSLAARLNRTLHNHASKTYSVPTHLVLDAFGVHAPLTTDQDADDILGSLLPPEQSRFLSIYVCLRSYATNAPVFFALELASA
jgi:hypothetical protein